MIGESDKIVLLPVRLKQYSLPALRSLAQLGGTRRPRARNHPRGDLNGPWAKLRLGHTEDTAERPAVYCTYSCCVTEIY